MGSGIMIIAAGAGMLAVTIIANIVLKSRQKKESERLFETLKRDYWLE